MIKKVIISAAGQGTRMLHLSEDKSKHLISVENRPFLAYLLDNVYKAGYKEIILVVGFRADLIEQFVAEFRKDKPDLLVEVISQFEILGPKEKEYGTACPIKCVKDMVGNENFISLCGDNFYTVEDLKAMNIDDDFNYVAALEHAQPEKFGVLVTGENGCLEKIVEKPNEFMGNLINTSLYKFTPDIFKKVFEIEKSPRGEYEITDAVSLLAKEKKVKVKKISDFWMDFGRPDDVKKFADFLKSAK
jgi:bifunctional UDP-N-acetylglucosamine pyrophosphorylase/glucosamine-1-phosphate N-acetyltransferase